MIPPQTALWNMVRFVVALCALGSSLYTTADAQVEVRSNAVQITITGRLHAQFNTTSVTDEPEAEFLIRRARLAAELRINDFVSGKVEPDFGEGKIALKDAWVRLTFDRAFRATVGQFKRPFDLFELTSSTQILVVERTGEVRGVDSCAGPGGTCTLSRLTEKLQLSDRDIGVMFDGTDPEGKFRYMVAVTNGTGSNTEDENGSKSFSGRIAVTPVKDVTIAGNVAAHDYLLPVAPDLANNEFAVAYGGDIEVGNFNSGLHFQGGVVAGDNWLNLIADEPTTFVTAQGILSWKVPVNENRFVSALEPVARVSWADPNTDLADDEGVLATGGLMVHFTGRNKIAANVDVWSPVVGDSEYSIKVQSYLYF